MKRKIFIIALVVSLIPFTAYTQSDTVIVNWATGWGTICGGNDFACNPPWTGSGNWNNGIRTFTDPVPPGNIVTKVEVIVYKVDCGLNTLTVELNGQPVSTECCVGNCDVGTCWPTNHIRIAAAGFPGYVYGGTNTLQLIPDTTNICVDKAEIILHYTSIQMPEICLVTVDTATNKNLVVWEKTFFPASSYNIYRETSTPGVYDSIANVPYNSLSNYLDVSSDPNTQSDRYKISWIDSLGNESGLSYEHKTIHLITDLDTINNRVQLTWDAYEGVSFCNYTIYRGVSPNNMDSLNIVPGDTTTYTDFSPLSDTSCYMIEVVYFNGCVATNPATNFNSSFSNISCTADTITTYVAITYDETISIHVYPNPFNSTTTFEIRGIDKAQPLTFSLYNIIGERIKEVSNIRDNKFIISRENLQGGIYIYKINSKNGLIGAGKLVVN